MKDRKQSVSKVKNKGFDYAVKDTLLFKAPEEGAPPYVGKVLEIKKSSSGKKELKVSWYYRPEDAVGGRKSFHGKKELFSSDHVDNVSAECIVGKCLVHTLPDYENLEEEDDTDFYTRFKYECINHTYVPDIVEVHCICEMPFNPDNPMVECDMCREWFHYKCLGLSESDLEGDTPFYCPHCQPQT